MEFDELMEGLCVPNPFEDFSSDFKLSISQNEMLKFIDESNFLLIYKRRQEGVSTAISVYMLWLLLNNPEYSILFLYSSVYERENFRQMINMNLSNIENIFKKKGINMMLTPERHDSQRTKLPNGSSILYRSKKARDATKGMTVNFIYVSELGFGDNFLELISCILPCITAQKNGRFLVTTTDLRNIREDFPMNGQGVSEYWCDSFFDGKRFVIIEKHK
jgi:hypothetical protein